MSRRFNMVRIKDISGVSGVGLVADGVEFRDGQVVISWRGRSVAIYPSIDELVAIHGHDNSTHVEWIDEEGA